MPSDITQEYDFIPADIRDKEEIFNLTLNDFLAIEPHSVALGITANNATEFIGSIVTRSLNFPFSYRVVHKPTGKLVAVLLISVCERDVPEDSNFDLEKQDEGIQIYVGIIDRLEEKFWERRPEVHKVLHHEISFVHSDHQRRGIAQHLLHLGLDFDSLRASGFDGIVSEASSFANQTLLLKNGFEEVARSQPEEYLDANNNSIVFPDQTREVKLLYLPI